MLTIIIFVLIIIALFNKNNKAISNILILLLIIAAYNVVEMADYEGYKKLYDNPDLDVRDIEPLAKVVVSFFKSLGFSFELYRIFFLSSFFLLVNHLVKKHTRYISFFWALYAISVLCMHIIWIRFSMGVFLVYIALDILCDKSKLNKKKYLVASCLMVLATFLHGGTICFLPLLLINLFSKKTILRFAPIVAALLMVVSYTAIMQLLSLYMAAEKADYLDYAYSHGESTSVQYQMVEALIFIFGVFVLLRIERKGVEVLPKNNEVETALTKIEFAEKINVFSLCIIPLMNLFDAFNRFFFYLFPFYLVILSLYYKWHKKTFIYDCLILAFTVVVLIMFVLLDESPRVGGFKALYHF